MRRPKKLNQEPVHATVTSLSHEGRGIAIIDGKTTFIRGALTDEDVLFTYTSKRKTFDEGKVTEVINPSPLRVVPKCPHFGLCGGCKLQHLSTEAQIQHKQTIFLEQLAHFGNVKPEIVCEPISGPEWGYRRKARLGVRYVQKKGAVLVGFREEGSHFIADIHSCDILDPTVGQLIPHLREFIETLDTFQHIPQIEVAVGDNDAALIFRHLEALSDTDVEKFTAFGQAHQIHIYLQPGGMNTIKKLWPDNVPERLSYAQPDHGLHFNFHPTDFTQVNASINIKMVNLALELLQLDNNDRVLDLFCGLGNFTLPIAKYCQHVVGIEGSQVMVERAAENAQLNNIQNTEFFAADLSEAVQQFPWFKQSYNKLLIDPARSGADKVIEQLKGTPFDRIVYVSCNPATLARDAGILVHEQGYRLVNAGILNMFPHTSHVESIALFLR